MKDEKKQVQELNDESLEQVDGGKMSKAAVASTVIGGVGAAATIIGLGTYFGLKAKKKKKEQKELVKYKAGIAAAEEQAKKDYEERSQTEEFQKAFEQFDTSNLPTINDPVEP